MAQQTFLCLGAILTLLAVAGCKPKCDLTDDEVIRKSVDYFISVQEPLQHWATSDGGTQTYHLKLYSSYDELVGENPDCCTIVQSFPEAGGPTGWQQWWYDFRGYAVVRVKDLRIVGTGIELYQRGAYLSAVDSCGERIKELNYFDWR